MRKLQIQKFLVLGLTVLALSAADASAASKKGGKAATAETPASVSSDQVRMVAASPSYSGGSSSTRFGLGYSSINHFANGFMNSAVTGMLQLSGVSTVQFYLTIPQTAGQFNVFGGAVYKHTVDGDRATGFHLGMGALAGSLGGEFALAIPVVGGFHYSPVSSVAFHFDGGPAFQLGGAGGQTNFTVGSFSGLLALSAVYFF